MRAFDIVHIAQTSFPDDSRPRREASVAANTGARVVVIALQDGLDPRPVGHYGQVAIVRLTGQRRRGSIARQASEYLSFLARAWLLMRKDLRFRNARIVHIHSLPDFLIAAAAPAQRRGARVILDLHEIFPEFTRAKLGRVLGPSAKRVAQWLERWSRRQADVTLTVNREIKALLASRPARPDERIVVIHNLTNPDDFGPASLVSGKVDGALRLVYHGTLTPMYGLDLAVTALALLRERGMNVTFDVFGHGPMHGSLERQIRNLQLTAVVRLRGPVSHRILRSELPTYHAGLLPTRLDEMTRFSLSTKLLEYVHLGIPIIAPRIPTYERYFPEGCATYFAPDDPVDAARAILAFATISPSARMAQAAAAQQAVADLTWAAEADRLRCIYQELLADTRSG